MHHPLSLAVLQSYHIYRCVELFLHHNVWTCLTSVSQFLPSLHMTYFDKDSIPQYEDLTLFFSVIVLFLLSLSMPRGLISLCICLLQNLDIITVSTWLTCGGKPKNQVHWEPRMSPKHQVVWMVCNPLNHAVCSYMHVSLRQDAHASGVSSVAPRSPACS